VDNHAARDSAIAEVLRQSANEILEIPEMLLKKWLYGFQPTKKVPVPYGIP